MVRRGAERHDRWDDVRDLYGGPEHDVPLARRAGGRVRGRAAAAVADVLGVLVAGAEDKLPTTRAEVPDTMAMTLAGQPTPRALASAQGVGA